MPSFGSSTGADYQQRLLELSCNTGKRNASILKLYQDEIRIIIY
jgi:hypothetical protein